MQAPSGITWKANNRGAPQPREIKDVSSCVWLAYKTWRSLHCFVRKGVDDIKEEFTSLLRSLVRIPMEGEGNTL